MITLILIILPLLAAAACWFFRHDPSLTGKIFAGTVVLHAVGVALLWMLPDFGNVGPELLRNWIRQDELSRVIQSVTTGLFLLVTIHMRFWLPEETVRHAKTAERLLAPWGFYLCLLGFLGTMTLVAASWNFGLLWVAVEATTLVSAPLILFHRSERSLEAMWKYILICSVGIGFALFGTLLLAASAHGEHASLSMDFMAMVPLRAAWFKAAFVFILAGYGTKMGLAPFHTWLPDAHSEAPGAVSALLSGALLNCSFLGIVRVLAVAPAMARSFCYEVLGVLGVCSLLVAAFFIVRQSDYKRMLAYSSVEHMGLIALLWAQGSIVSERAAVFHLCGHSMLKMMLFLIAGNLLLACGTRKIGQISGLLGKVPGNALIWMAGTLLLCGMPPSPLFVTEFMLIATAPWYIGGTVLLLLFIVFAGMSWNVMKMVFGPDGIAVPGPEAVRSTERLIYVPLAVLLLVLIGGAWLTFQFMRIF